MRYLIERHKAEMAEAAKLPTVTVTRKEFIRLAKAAGWSADKANLQAKLCKSLGSAVRIGQQLVRIEETAP